jgi:hypothetical protein
MRSSLTAVLLFASFVTPASLSAQTSASGSTPAPVTVQRDTQAVTVLQQSMQAMGTSVPSDSIATGSISTIAGGQTSVGTFQVETKGLNETSVQITTPGATQTTVYANGQASAAVGSTPSALSLESAVTSQAAEFPLPLIAALLNNADTSFQYVGLETDSGQSLHHIRAWDSFASQSFLQSLSSLSYRDIWINSTTLLPQRVSFVRRPAQGAVPGIAVDVFFMGYTNSAGVLYPSSIQESVNGTPWATITIQSVAFNTGLTDSDFPVQ